MSYQACCSARALISIKRSCYAAIGYVISFQRMIHWDMLLSLDLHRNAGSIGTIGTRRTGYWYIYVRGSEVLQNIFEWRVPYWRRKTVTRVCTDVLYLGLGARIRRVRSKRLSNYHLTKSEVKLIVLQWFVPVPRSCSTPSLIGVSWTTHMLIFP